METLIIAIVVLAAVCYLAIVLRKASRSKPGAGCGGDCGNCRAGK